MYQPVQPSTDPVPLSTNRYRLLLTQYNQYHQYHSILYQYHQVWTITLIQCHQVHTSSAPYWLNAIMYQPVPPSADPVPSYINQYHSILTQYRQVLTSIAL